MRHLVILTEQQMALIQRMDMAALTKAERNMHSRICEAIAGAHPFTRGALMVLLCCVRPHQSTHTF